MHVTANVEERPANWLPIPGELQEAARRRVVVDENDMYSKGEVAAYHPRQREGFIKTARGEMIPFSAEQSSVIGDIGNLEQGARIGFDASMTPHGMRVTILKIY